MDIYCDIVEVVYADDRKVHVYSAVVDVMEIVADAAFLVTTLGRCQQLLYGI